MNKIFVALLLFFIPVAVWAQTKGLDNNPLVEVKQIIPDIVLDIRYATPNNFLKQTVYPEPVAFLRKTSVEKLKVAAEILRTQGYRIKLFDAYRPLTVQKKMWAIMPNSRYVANPSKGSVHNRGGAVDLTLVTLDGKDVEMPSEYDEFNEKAHHGYPMASDLAKNHVAILKEAMLKAGFKSIPTEWWHYNDPEAKAWPVLDK
ncbi:MAG: M15 family metallopeptidase [Deltaproteobacteria bacterium]|nr:M15 family metallopeptidase [Deltaproteobacteria bacterium]